jgi:hypothetical protein
MTESEENKKENALHPVGQNFLVQCVGYRGLAHRNMDGEWKSIFTNRTLPRKISFLPPVETIPQTLPDVQAVPLIVCDDCVNLHTQKLKRSNAMPGSWTARLSFIDRGSVTGSKSGATVAE